ncbi:MAG: extracellular solute-binding protein [Alphaproteobacteria bacterium]|nr:extracellular solute-binding protein [Alphaproteobacteria bacterium]
MNRTIIIAAVVIALAAIGGAILFTGGGKPTLTVVSWGGAYTKSQIEAYHKPFTQSRDVSIASVDYNGDIALIKAQVGSGNVTWDIVDFEVADAIRACDEGLLETIDPASLPPAPDGTQAVDDFLKGTVTPCYVPTIVFSHVIAYDTSRLAGRAPQTAADFFDLVTFPGKRGLRKTSPKVNLELALLADGVPSDQLYAVLSTPEGIDRAFAKLDSIKGSVVWWEAGAQPPQLLADGEVAMTTAYNGRIFDAMVAGKPFKIVWRDHLLDLDVWGIVKGTPNKDLALDFLQFSTDTERLTEQARYISYAPARQSSLTRMAELDLKHIAYGIPMLEHMPTAPQNMANAVPLDHRWWADHQDELFERWSAWLAN